MHLGGGLGTGHELKLLPKLFLPGVRAMLRGARRVGSVVGVVAPAAASAAVVVVIVVTVADDFGGGGVVGGVRCLHRSIDPLSSCLISVFLSTLRLLPLFEHEFPFPLFLLQLLLLLL